MKLAVQNNYFGGQIWYKSPDFSALTFDLSRENSVETIFKIIITKYLIFFVSQEGKQKENI